jgi:hypothetical protein
MCHDNHFSLFSFRGARPLPFETICLPLNYSGNPGANVESYWETPAAATAGRPAWEGTRSAAIPTLMVGKNKNAPGNCEDPFLYFDRFGRFHVLAHVRRRCTPLSPTLLLEQLMSSTDISQ